MADESMEDSVDLIRRIANQDRGAFETFYDRYSPLAYTFALRILRSKTDAEDLIQEVFVQAWKNASSYDPKRGKPEAWIITITKTRAIDKLRSYRRQDKGALSIEDSARIRTEEAAGREGMESVTRLTLSGVLDELSEVQRTALQLAYFEGLTQTEIAERLGIPVGTVKTRIRDGLLKLRQLLKGEEKQS